MGKRTTQLGEITTIDDNDILYGVDVDDLTHSPDGTSVKFKKSNLLKEVNSRISGLLDWFYPIGTIYETTSSDLDTTTKMGNHFGGTWEVYGAGRVLVAKSSDTEFDTIGETGGEKTHTLSVAEMPSHTHSRPDSPTNNTGVDWVGAKGTSAKISRTTGPTGGGEAHNNLQPYIVVYRYRRIA